MFLESTIYMNFKRISKIVIFKHYERFLNFFIALENTYFPIIKVIYSHLLEIFNFIVSWMTISKKCRKKSILKTIPYIFRIDDLYDFKRLPQIVILKHYGRFLNFFIALENTYFLILKVIYSHHLEIFNFIFSWMTIFKKCRKKSILKTIPYVFRIDDLYEF